MDKPEKKKPAARKSPAKKKAAPKKKTDLKISAEEKKRFPHSTFPVKVYHREGKDFQDLKVCFFQCMDHAEKYLKRQKFRKNQYLLFEKK